MGYGDAMSGRNLDAAIDAAARAMFTHDQQLRTNSAGMAWEAIHPSLQEDWLSTARIAIGAAWPSLLTEFLQEFVVPSAQDNQHRPQDCPCCRAAMSLSDRVDRGKGGQP